MNQFKGSVALEHMHHAYAKTDGTYDFPNSREGDILRRCKKELEYLLERSDNSDYAVPPTTTPNLPSFVDVVDYCQKTSNDGNWGVLDFYSAVKKLGNFS